jgi:glycosyltransferase involved in cell wall biosynthesis/2-polyprenyl-3-methyl-5-hydroxy-6-metoxy-1,4-benzoquinol methylase
MVYPGVPDFDETSCIAALEAQACRTPLVASRKGGLIETLAHGAGALIGGDAYSDGYQQEFINQTFDLLDDPERYTQAQQVGRDWVESQYQYKTIATEWEKNLDLFFETRFNTYKSQIFDNLLHHDDFATAHHIVEHKEIKEAQALDLYGALSQDHTEEDYDVMMLDPEEEEQAVEDGRHFRLETVLQLLDPKRSGLEPKSILDYGCGGGIFASALQRMFPKANVLGLDFSGGIVDKGNQFIRSQEWNDSKVPLILEADLVNQGTLQEVKSDGETYMSPEQKFDLILVGELLEHYIEPMELISALDDVLAEGGTICWTVPNGPFVELADTERERTERTHRIHWEYNTVKEVFGGKADFDIRYICINNSTGIRGLDKGHYVFSHKKEGQYGEINFDKKYKLTRPYQKVSACLIARNNEKDIARCLDSIHQVADEIIIADNGSTDSTLEIAEKYGAKIINLPEKWPQAPEWAPAPGNFSWMRNESVKPATGDWILWIDTDEELRNGHLLGQYLQSRLFDGFVLRQNHLMVDVDTKSHDTPVRVYRADQGFEFYGCIHEHAHKSLNQPIEPSLELDKTDIIHYGYVTEDIRRYKCMTRNMMLMKLDRAVHPGRLLGWCLLAREYLNLASWEKQDDPRAPFSQMTERRLREVVRIFHDPDLDLSNPEGRYYKIIFPLYQSALKCLDAGIPVEVDVKVSQNGQGFRFLDQEDLERHLNFNLHGMTSKLPPQGRNKTYLTQVEG